MSSIPDTDAIWAALMADPRFIQETPASLFPLMRELVDELPEVLQEHLDKPAALESILSAQLSVLRRLSGLDLLEKMGDALASDGEFLEDAGLEASDVTIGRLAIIHIRGRRRLRKAIEETAMACLADPSIEAKLMEPHSSRFNAAALAAYEAGSLTIGKLLELQPAALLTSRT